MFGKNIGEKLRLSVLLVALLLAATQCATKPANVSPAAPNLPDNLFGVKLGMTKDEAEMRLRETAEFREDAEKRQQVWVPKNDARYDSVAIGYGRDGRVRYITAFSEAGKAKERVRFGDVGDVSKAIREVTEPHHRYTWEVPEVEGKPAYIITAYGTDKEYLTMFSLAEKAQPEKGEGKE